MAIKPIKTFTQRAKNAWYAFRGQDNIYPTVAYDPQRKGYGD